MRLIIKEVTGDVLRVEDEHIILDRKSTFFFRNVQEKRAKTSVSARHISPNGVYE